MARSSLFISYRHKDAWEAAALVRVLLQERFKRTDIFWDIESIALGDKWPAKIEETYARCKALLAIIGPGWAGEQSSAFERAIDNPNDWLRREIEAAIARGILIIPILVNNAVMPREDELPPSLVTLATLQAVWLTRTEHRGQIDRLIRRLELLLEPPVDQNPGDSVSQLPASTAPETRRTSEADPAPQPEAAIRDQDLTLDKGDFLYQLGDIDAAKKAIQMAIARGHPDVLPQAYNRLGVLKRQEGDLEGAERAFRRALAYGDHEVSPRAAFNLGNLLSRLGDRTSAKHAYRRAIDFHDAAVSPRAYNNLGLLLEKEGRVREAREAFAAAVSFRDTHGAPRAALNLGRMFENSAEVSAAVSAYREAIDLDHPAVTPLARERLQRLLRTTKTSQDQ